MTEDGSNKDTFIEYLGLSNYLSFGREHQLMGPFSKINLFLGQNNVGKSVILNWFYKHHAAFVRCLQEPGSTHIFKSIGDIAHRQTFGDVSDESQQLLSVSIGFRDLERHYTLLKSLVTVERPGNEDRHRKMVQTFFREDISAFIFCYSLRDDRFKLLENLECNRYVSDVRANPEWVNSMIEFVPSRFNPRDFEAMVNGLSPAAIPSVDAHFIPAYRRPESAAPQSPGSLAPIHWDNQGRDLVYRLSQLQNPDYDVDHHNEIFEKINRFFQQVTGSPEATIEIPFARDEIRIRMRGKQWKLSELGTGIHEVVMLAAWCTIFENQVVCLEEPEIHLHPLLQKRLLQYLATETSNQYFIATHSPHLVDLDIKNKSVFHVRMEKGETRVELADSDSRKVAICRDLGFHPSDILQANCIIWVEGPSDRMYLTYWLQAKAPDLIENIHFSIMFYAGSLGKYLDSRSSVDSENSEEDVADDSASEGADAIESFIDLRRLNQHMVLITDRDTTIDKPKIDKRKERLVAAFDREPGFVWITQGRTIEHYLPRLKFRSAVQAVHSRSKIPAWIDGNVDGGFENILQRETSKKDKNGLPVLVEIAKVKCAAKFIGADENVVPELIGDLEPQITRLIAFIRDSNPSVDASAKGENLCPNCKS